MHRSRRFFASPPDDLVRTASSRLDTAPPTPTEPRFALMLLSPTSDRRVVVTGLGALTPIGNSVQAYWDGRMASRSGGL